MRHDGQPTNTASLKIRLWEPESIVQGQASLSSFLVFLIVLSAVFLVLPLSKFLIWLPVLLLLVAAVIVVWLWTVFFQGAP